MREAERRLRRRLRDDFPFYAERCLWIRPKAGGLAPFRLNAVQRFVHGRLEDMRERRGRVRALVLKARQPGVSTLVQARYFWRVSHQRGVRAFILTHRQEATENLFGMASRFHRHCPEALRPRTSASNARELAFDGLDSGYRVGTAGAADVGRSDTIQYFHGSEVAFWPNAAEHMAGVLQAIPERAGTEVILESTGNGIGGLFHNLCRAAMRGEGEYELVFVPWFLHEEYRADAAEGDEALPAALVEYAALHGLDPAQARWAARKNAELAAALRAPADAICWRFRQEYPATVEEAFQAADHDAFIRPEHVIRARAFVAPDQSHAPLVLGVDVARGGGDRTRILDRQGRVLGARVNLVLDTADLMAVAGTVARTIERLDPAMSFVDATGLGAGVYDRLAELGFARAVRPVNFGAAASDGRAFANKRTEMWAALRDWLADPAGADIPDEDGLHAELTAPGYRHDSQGRLLLERKEEVRARTGFSPDGADAAALTFAEPVRPAARGRRRPARAESVYRVLG